MTYRASLLCFAAALSLTAADPVARGRAAEPSAPHKQGDHEQSATATPIQHLVVIFQENVSFDHYFGTYPKAENRPGETRFSAAG
jgi:phospholipase C